MATMMRAPLLPRNRPRATASSMMPNSRTTIPIVRITVFWLLVRSLLADASSASRPAMM